MVVTSKPCSTTCPRLVGQDGARQNTQTRTSKRIVQQIESLVCTIYVWLNICANRERGKNHHCFRELRCYGDSSEMWITSYLKLYLTSSKALSNAAEDAYLLLLLPEQQELCASSPWCLLGKGGRAALGTHTGSWQQDQPFSRQEAFLGVSEGFLHAAPRPLASGCDRQQMTS